jgi:hypothetical protein
MKIIAAKKDETIYFGNIPKVANLIGINPVTIRRWIKDEDRKVYKNGYEIYLNTEKL